MGYFSNGCEGDCYRAEYCFKCQNWICRPGEPEEGCKIMDLHFLYGYKLCNSRSLAKSILDTLIPCESKPFPHNGKCRMFLPIKEQKGK